VAAPAVIVAFRMSIVDSGLHYTFAAFVLCGGLDLAIFGSLAYWLALRRTTRSGKLRRRRIYALSASAAVVLLLSVPFVFMASEFLVDGMNVERSEARVFLPATFTAIVAAASYILGLGIGRVSRYAAEFPECPACGYNLTGNVSGTCPECGGNAPRDM